MVLSLIVYYLYAGRASMSSLCAKTGMVMKLAKNN